MKKINYLFLLLIFSIVLASCTLRSNKSCEHVWVDGFCELCNQKEYSEDLQYEEIYDGALEVIGREDTDALNLIIPSEHEGKKVVGIGESAFERCKARTIELEEGIEYIESRAFKEINNALEITLPNSIKYISNLAFSNITRNTIFTLYNDGYYLGNEENPYLFLHHVNVNAQDFLIHKDTVFVGEINYDAYREDGFLYLASEDNPYMVLCGQYKIDHDNTMKINENIEVIYYNNKAYPYSLKEATIPKSVRQICANGFVSSYFGKLTLLCDLYTVEERVFNSPEIKELIFEGNIINLESDAFNAIGVKKIELPKSLKSMGYSSFGYSKIEEITIPDDVMIIPDHAFTKCKYLKSFNCNARIIKYGAFFNCGFENLEIPNSVEVIDNTAFYYNQELIEVKLPKNLKKLEDEVFRACPKLEKVILNSNLESVASNAFDQDNTNIYNEYDGAYYLQSTTNKYYAYIKEVSSPSEKEEINVKDGTVLIGGNAFSSINKTVNLPKSIDYLSDGAFEKYYGKTIELNDGLKKIGRYAFAESSITQIEIPISVSSIGDGAFGGTNITSIALPALKTEIGYGLFIECKLLQTVDLGKMSVIPQMTFMGCESLTTIINNAVIKEVEYGAFYGCKSLTTIGESRLSKIGMYAFYECEKLEYIGLDDSLRIIEEYAFYACVSLEIINFSKSLRIIEEYAFYACVSLDEIKLNEGLLEIKNEAFMFCGDINTLVVPKSLKVVGSNAFDCTDITNLYYNSTFEDYKLITFKNNNDNLRVYSDFFYVKVNGGYKLVE